MPNFSRPPSLLSNHLLSHTLLPSQTPYSPPLPSAPSPSLLSTLAQVPQLRRACLENGIHITVVDLRLGVTDNDQREKRTLGICLDLVSSSEIFVNFWGER